MRKNWQNYINHVLDFGPIIATVFVAAFASLRATRGSITSSEMLQLVLIVLTLLATTQMVDRFRILRDIDTKIGKLIKVTQGPTRASSFFQGTFIELDDRIRRAKTVAVNGLTLIITSNKSYGALQECLSNGGQVRLIVVAPDHPAMEIATARFHKHQDLKFIQNDARQALHNFKSLRDSVRDKDRLQVRLSPFVPPYAIWLIDADSAEAEIHIGIYPFRERYHPSFGLVRSQDKEWFDYFQTQFEKMWEASEPCNMDSSAV